MAKNLCITSTSTIELENIRINKLHKTGKNIIKGGIVYNDNKLLIKGPRMTLGSSINKNGDYYYIDLRFSDKNTNQKFMKCINDIDCLVMIDIYENYKLWYGSNCKDVNEEISFTQIEQEYIPSVKKSSLHNGRFTMKFKVHNSKIEFFDQDNIVVPYQLIKDNFVVIPLLQLKALYKDSNHIWLNWSIPQLKIELPDNIFKKCQLVDIDDSEDSMMENEVIPDDDYENN